jgi:hypothetical protein
MTSYTIPARKLVKGDRILFPELQADGSRQLVPATVISSREPGMFVRLDKALRRVDVDPCYRLHPNDYYTTISTPEERVS